MKKTATPRPIDDDRLELLFRHAGLSEKQAKLYRLLLVTGDERPSVLAKKSGMKRGNIYALLRDLKSRGLVTEFEKGKVVSFRPEPPRKILDIIESRQREVAAAKTLANDLIPQMTSQWKSAVGRPTITYLEGEEGVYKIFTDIYAPGKTEVIGCVGLEEPNEELYTHIIKRLLPLRIRRKIFARAINPDSPRAQMLKTQEQKNFCEIFLADPKKYPLPAEIDVYTDKVAFLSFANNDFIGLLLENQAFATTMRSIFTLLYDLMREREQKEQGMDHQKAHALSQKNMPPEH